MREHSLDFAIAFLEEGGAFYREPQHLEVKLTQAFEGWKKMGQLPRILTDAKGRAAYVQAYSEMTRFLGLYLINSCATLPAAQAHYSSLMRLLSASSWASLHKEEFRLPPRGEELELDLLLPARSFYAILLDYLTHHMKDGSLSAMTAETLEEQAMALWDEPTAVLKSRSLVEERERSFPPYFETELTLEEERILACVKSPTTALESLRKHAFMGEEFKYLHGLGHLFPTCTDQELLNDLVLLHMNRRPRLDDYLTELKDYEKSQAPLAGDQLALEFLAEVHSTMKPLLPAHRTLYLALRDHLQSCSFAGVQHEVWRMTEPADVFLLQFSLAPEGELHYYRKALEGLYDFHAGPESLYQRQQELLSDIEVRLLLEGPGEGSQQRALHR